MRKNSSNEGGRNRRESRGSRRSKPSRGTLEPDRRRSQLLERGQGPAAEEQIDPAVDSPSEITSEGGPGSDAAYEFGGTLSEAGEPPNPRTAGTGGEAGYSTLGGGVYPDEGASEDAPRYGDWQRHSSGTSRGTSRARSGSPGRRRSDESLAREIREILTKDPELDATDIEVEVEHGAVRLIGVVDSSDAKLLAEELVESIPGVREVNNELRVSREATS